MAPYTKATPLHRTFSLADVYAHADTLAKLHPANRHIQPKIRQQLQVLRDWGLVEFVGGGAYRLN
jgi:type II restriction enzyme